ncbi:hypothetical protein ASZ90_002631 [hydrocarbon metagenome]|uniref:Uncharacterized protein n=1 Tax=hydrocarbon metagenome TaxID=938273 RepID=A0A0W8G2Z2_9ZZZZ
MAAWACPCRTPCRTLRRRAAVGLPSGSRRPLVVPPPPCRRLAKAGKSVHSATAAPQAAMSGDGQPVRGLSVSGTRRQTAAGKTSRHEPGTH